MAGLAICLSCRSLEPTTPPPTTADTPVVRPPATWGQLQPGPFAVGFRQLAFDDPSRTYRLHSEPHEHPRPVVAGVWYPAAAQTGDPLVLGDYFTLQLEDPARADFASVISGYLYAMMVEEALGQLPGLLSPDEQATLERVLATPTFARRRAHSAVSTAPMLLAHPGLGGVYADGMVLFEYLASRGWVVVAGLVQQSDGNWLNVGWDPVTSVRDLKLLRERAPAALGIEPTGLAMLGHSYGAQAALIYTAMFDDVDAVVSLDSTMDGRDAAQRWWASEDNAPWLDHGSDIDVPALLLASAGRGRNYFDTLAAVPREYIAVEGLEHNDFEGLGGVLRPMLGACPPTNDCALLHQRYQAIVTLTADFLDTSVRPTASAPAQDQAATQDLAALGFTRTRVLEPATRTTPPAPFPALEPTEPDCRSTDSCAPDDRIVAHATELLALGRIAEAEAMVEAARARAPQSPDLMEMHAQLLLQQGRHGEAADVYEDERKMLAASKERSDYLDYRQDQAKQRSERARALASTAPPSDQ
ncbi:MAG: alpha/beta hydrolase [Deltaproteobacteria bacterium]|nr:alpha/beta hydrolase [Deltaproteobacteria bacterium]